MTPEEYGKKKRRQAVVAVYLILRRGDEVLLALRQNTGYEDGNWNVPSGHLEGDELPTEALIREVREEIGIELLPGHLEAMHTSFRPQHDPTGPRIDLYFMVWEWTGEIVNGEPEKCTELRWFGIDELPSNVTPHIQEALARIEEDDPYSELDLEWLKERGLYKL